MTKNIKEMSDVKPVLFSGPMIRALLDGRKTQTRRVLKPQPPDDACCKAVAVETEIIRRGLIEMGAEERQP